MEDIQTEQQDTAPTIEDLMSAAAKADAGEIDPGAEGAQETSQDRSGEDADKNKDKPKEGEETPDKDKSENKELDKESGTKPTEEESKYIKAQKEKERQDRSWKKLEEEKAALKAEREAIEAERKKAPASKDAIRDENGFTAEQYEEYAKDAEDPEFSKRARERAEALRKQESETTQKRSQEDFNKGWTDNLNALLAEKADLKDENSVLGKKVSDILKNNVVFSLHPDGIKHAVAYAEAQLSAGLVPDLQAEVTKLNAEIERLNKALQPGGGGPNQKPTSKSFDEMSTDERTASLRQMAEEADRG